MHITFNEATLCKNSALVPMKDDKPDAKLANWAAEQLRVDAMVTKEKLLRSSFIAAFGEVPSKSKIKKRLQVITHGKVRLVYWAESDSKPPVLLCAFTEPELGMDPDKANRVVCRFHFKDMVNENITASN